MCRVSNNIIYEHKGPYLRISMELRFQFCTTQAGRLNHSSKGLWKQFENLHQSHPFHQSIGICRSDVIC